MIDYGVYFVAFSAVRADMTNDVRDNSDQHENQVRSLEFPRINWLKLFAPSIMGSFGFGSQQFVWPEKSIEQFYFIYFYFAWSIKNMPLLYLIHFLMVVHKIHKTYLHNVPRVLTVRLVF